MILSKRKSSIIVVSFLFFTSCEKEELPVLPHEQGDTMEQQVAMGEDYGNQIFFDLGSNEVISSNLKSIWDLGFESNPDGDHIILNSAKGMAVSRSDMSFSELTSVTGLEWNWDAHSGNLDSTAIGDWQVDQKLYVVDRGYNEAGTHLGYMKMQLLTVDGQAYEIRTGHLSDQTGIIMEVGKDASTAFTYFSFDNGLVEVAPADDAYDLVFTQYTHLFTDPLTPYLVAGVLLNRNGTKAILVEDKSYQAITLQDTQGFSFSTDLNVIGYDWKYYNFDQGQYTVYPEMVYVIKTAEGYYYKLHFTGFYNQQGLKGYPAFEFQQL